MKLADYWYVLETRLCKKIEIPRTSARDLTKPIRTFIKENYISKSLYDRRFAESEIRLIKIKKLTKELRELQSRCRMLGLKV